MNMLKNKDTGNFAMILVAFIFRRTKPKMNANAIPMIPMLIFFFCPKIIVPTTTTRKIIRFNIITHPFE